MLGFLTKKEKAQIFSIPQNVITNRGILNIDKIKKGYMIVGDGGKVNQVEKVEKSIKSGYFYVVNKRLVLYENQSIMLGQNAVHAKDLKRKDELTEKDGSKTKIATIKKIKGSYYFHKLTVGGDHTYYINDILVHNASRYWVGGTASWNTSNTGKWSTTSGGASGSGRPTSSDVAFFDSASGAVTITLAFEGVCGGLTMTGFTGTFAMGANQLDTWGNIVVGSGMSFTYTAGTSNFLTFATLSVTSNGVSMPGIWCGTDATTVTISDNTTCDTVTLQRGTFTVNNVNLTIPQLTLTNTSSTTVNCGTGTWTITGLTPLSAANSSFTWNASTSTIKLTNSSNSSLTFSASTGVTYKNVWFSRGASTGDILVTDANTYADFKDDGTAAHSIKFTHGVTQTFTTFTVSGTAGNLITITSDTTATHTLSCASGTISSDYLSVQHSVATGGATWNAGSHSTNNQAVSTAGSGWNFPTNWTQTLSDTTSLSDTLLKSPQRILSEVLSMIDNTLGSELAVNGSFSTNTDWTKEAGWTIAAGVATATSVAGAAIYENIGTVAHYYEITYTISGYVAGGLAIKAGTETGTVRSANGTYTERITVLGNGNMGVVTVGITTASIDNISIKEVTFAGFTWLDVIAKTYTETLATTDTLIKLGQRVLTETLVMVATSIQQAIRTFTETVTNTDTLASLRVTPKTLSEVLSMVDITIGRIITHVMTETLVMVASIVKISNRLFSEVTSLTDTFVSLRTTFGLFIETVSTTDVIARLEQRILTETTTLTASLSTLRTRMATLSETVSTGDTFLRTITLVMTETLSLADTFLKVLTKAPLVETLVMVASIVKISNRLFSEVTTTTDTVIKLGQRIFTETTHLTDQLIVIINGIVTNLWSKVARTIDSWNKQDRN